MKSRVAPFAAAIVICWAVFACSTPQQFVSSAAKFAVATNNLADAADLYFGIANNEKFETEIVQARTMGAEIAKSSIDETFFPPDDMEARLALLATMRSFANSLADVANQNLGDEFRQEVGQLKSDVLMLRDRLDSTTDSELKRLVTDQSLGFGSAVIGEIGGAIIEQMQADAIVDAILSAGPAMSNATELLAQDMNLVFSKLNAERSIQAALAVDAWNRDRESANSQQRERLITAVEDQRQQLLTTDAIATEFHSTLMGYQKALISMLEFARSKREPSTLPELVASVDVFASRATRLIEAIRSSL